MSRLIWGSAQDRTYEVGADRGVLYLRDGRALPWNGLIGVREAPQKQGETVSYFDGQKFHNKAVSDSFAGVVVAFTYPDELEDGDIFGFSYRTMVGNASGDLRSKIHLVYNPSFEPTDGNFNAEGENPDLAKFSWTFTTVPVRLPGLRPTAHITIDCSIAHPWTVEAIEDVLYGTETTPPTLPHPIDVLDIFESNAILRIIDHGDGTWTAIGPDEAIQMLGSDIFEISWPSAVYIDGDTYTISSL